MTNETLAQSYRRKALSRMRVLEVLLEEESFSDVVREAQELVELALKGLLRHVGVEPPKWHDVGPSLIEFRERFPLDVLATVDELARISAWLRKERELAFYGDIDFLPTEQYTRADADRALEDARFVLDVVTRAIPAGG